MQTTNRLLADCKMVKDSLAKASPEQGVRELLALQESIISYLKEQDEERLQPMEAALEELLEGGGEMLQPQTTAKIVGVFEIGRALTEALTKAVETIEKGEPLDDLTKKKFADLKTLYLHTAHEVTLELQELTAEFDIPTDDDDDDADEGDDDNADEGEEDTDNG
jgi:hypothetical protein